jgi:uncharacterized protein YgiM (DUF1202 family)
VVSTLNNHAAVGKASRQVNTATRPEQRNCAGSFVNTTHHTVRCLALTLALLAAACGVTVTPTPIPATPTPSPVPQVVSTRLMALLVGQVELVDQCLRVRSRDGSVSLLLVWPADITATVSGETVLVTDLLLKTQATWYLGDIVTMAGGNLPTLDKSVQPIGPANCPGPYWVVGSVDPSATPTAAPSSTPAPTLTATPTLTPPPASVEASQPVNLRAGPGTEYDVVGQLTAGQTYPVVGQVGEWWAVTPDNGRTAWVLKLVVAFTGDAQTVPVSAAPPTPTIPPGASEVTQDGIVTFTSTVFGITFSYKPAQLGAQVRTRVAADRVYVSYVDNVTDPGQYVQVFHKTPSDSLQQAIQEQILRGYRLDDCRLVLLSGSPNEGVTAPRGYVFAKIRLPPPPSTTPDPSADMLATQAAQYQSCPQPYTEFGGQVYFMEDTRHPDRFFFLKIGQYSIFSIGPSVYGDPWQSTLRVMDVGQ